MKKSVQELREERGHLVNQMEAVVDGEGEWAGSREEQFQNLDTAIKSKDDEIAAAERFMRLAAQRDEAIDRRQDRDDLGSRDEAEAKMKLDRDAMSAWLRGGTIGMSEDQVEHYNSGAPKFIDHKTGEITNNALQVGTDSEGGYTVPDEISTQLIQQLQDYDGIREVANVERRSTTRKEDWPSAGVPRKGGTVAEETASTVTTQTIVFGNKQMVFVCFTSEIMIASVDLLRDSQYDIEGRIRAWAAEAIGTAQAEVFATGRLTPHSGSAAAVSGIDGFFATVARNSTLTASGTAVTNKDLNSLRHSVNRAYRKRNRGMFLMNDDTVNHLEDQTVSATDMRPLVDYNARADLDHIRGIPYAVVTDAPSIPSSASAGNYPIAYGDPAAAYTILDVPDAVEIHRYTDSTYARKRQVAFEMFMWSAGRVVDANACRLMHLKES